jgi:hypothetical protein
MGDFDKNIHAFELNLEALLKLLGGTADERERYWGVVKGITTPAEFRLTESALHAAASQVKVVQGTLEAAQAAARVTGKTRAAA